MGPLLLHSPFAVRAMGRMLDGPGASVSVDLENKALELLGKLCRAERSVEMRACATEALGNLRRPETVWVLLRVAAEDDAGDNRATALHGILRLLQEGMLDDHLETLIGKLSALQDNDVDRYVVAYAAEGIHQVNYRL